MQTPFPAMIPLPKTFRQGGFDFRLLKRRGSVALFAKSKGGGRDHHELVIIQQRPAETIYGRQYPARETMPSSEDWGTYGWSPHNLAEAERRFAMLADQWAAKPKPEPEPAITG